ncbi:uncharacterized protein J3D65DRAFT_68310 [Phyllosticta citribraziliensis]|uniref:Uncharacterized protein n=1 Tax=Phyllosticta citribraziliensis TaxID=989973 RepID=A0ABR1LGN8_9PEZI
MKRQFKERQLPGPVLHHGHLDEREHIDRQSQSAGEETNSKTDGTTPNRLGECKPTTSKKKDGQAARFKQPHQCFFVFFPTSSFYSFPSSFFSFPFFLYPTHPPTHLLYLSSQPASPSINRLSCPVQPDHTHTHTHICTYTHQQERLRERKAN